jgi:uncharacterized protein (TIRG00374 family)
MSRWKQVASALFSIALVVAMTWYFLPQFTSVSEIKSSIDSMTTMELVTLGIAALWNLVTYTFVMVTTMPGLTYRQAFVVTESSTAVSNTVPGGGAVGIAMSYSMYSSWGFSRSRGSVSLLLSGVWNNFAKLGLPIFAISIVAIQGGAGGGRLVAALAGIGGLVFAIVVFALLLKSEEGARRIGIKAGKVASRLRGLFGRPPVEGWEIATTKFRARTITLLRARWHWLTLATVVSHLSLWLVLLMALRYIGVSQAEVSWAEVLAVFSFARLLTAIPFTPGGVGVVELALITSLSAAGGPRAQVAAAVLVFRALTYVLPIPVGVGTYIFWRRNRSWRRPQGTAPRTELVPESV